MISGQISQSIDVVGVFNADFAQLFPSARPIKASVKETARMMEHPVESGAVITDHRVIDPTEIELTVICASEDYPNVYAQIREAFTRTDLLTVQTKTGSYGNMVISAMPHDETADVASAVPIALKFREVLLVTAQFQALPPAAVQDGPEGKGKRNVSTVKRGEQTGKAEPTNSDGSTKSSALYKIIYGD